MDRLDFNEMDDIYELIEKIEEEFPESDSQESWKFLALFYC